MAVECISIRLEGRRNWDHSIYSLNYFLPWFCMLAYSFVQSYSSCQVALFIQLLLQSSLAQAQGLLLLAIAMAPSLLASPKHFHPYVTISLASCPLFSARPWWIIILNTAIVCLEIMSVLACLNYRKKNPCFRFIVFLSLKWADEVSDRLALGHIHWRHAVSSCLVFWIDFSEAALAFVENSLSFQEQFMFASVLYFAYEILFARLCSRAQVRKLASLQFGTTPFRAYKSFNKMERTCISG